MGCSSKTYTFEQIDADNLNVLRCWIRTYFAKERSLFYDKESKLDSRLENLEIEKDLLVHVVQKVVTEEGVVLFIQDDTDACEVHTFKYFDYINPGDIVRIRSFKAYDK